MKGIASYKKLMGQWAPLMLPRFKCGHEKTQSNTITFQNRNRHGNMKERTRCKFCHDRRRA